MMKLADFKRAIVNMFNDLKKNSMKNIENYKNQM